MPDDRVQTISREQLAALCGRSVGWVKQLRRAGYLAPVSHGAYPLTASIRGVIAYYEDLIARSEERAATASATSARTREVELRIAQRERDLIPLADAEMALADMAQRVRSEFSSLPDAGRWDADLRDRIRGHVDGVLAGLDDEVAQAVAALRAGDLDALNGGQ